MGIGEKLQEYLQNNIVFTIHVGGLVLPVSETIVVSWVIMGFLIIFAFLASRNLKTIPHGTQCLVESIIEFLENFSREQFGKFAKLFGPYIGTVFLYLFVANIIPAFTPVSALGREAPFMLKPPARDINIPAALALLSIVLVIISSIAAKGFKGWIKTFFEPVPVMLPFNILEYIIKPVTLCLRLFGNVLGAFIIMMLIDIALENAMGFSLGISVIASIYFDFLDGFIQALVFTFLTSLYLSEAVSSHSH